MDIQKKCELCSKRLYLEVCYLCSGTLCMNCVKPINHVCKYLVQLGNIVINPIENRISIECPNCKNNIDKNNYRERLIELFNQRDLLKKNIELETKNILENEWIKKRNTLYQCMTFDINETDYYRLAMKKEESNLINLEFTIWKTIIDIHLKEECGIKKILISNTKPIKMKCNYLGCKMDGILLNCNKCNRKYCTKHLLPEIHLCRKALITPRYAILGK